jgi:hypothetical protein
MTGCTSCGVPAAVTTPLTATCPSWCQRHAFDPSNRPENYDHVATVADDLTRGQGRFRRHTFEVTILQASYDDQRGEIWLDGEAYSAEQARLLASALVTAAELLEQDPQLTTA